MLDADKVVSGERALNPQWLGPGQGYAARAETWRLPACGIGRIREVPMLAAQMPYEKATPRSTVVSALLLMGPLNQHLGAVSCRCGTAESAAAIELSGCTAPLRTLVVRRQRLVEACASQHHLRPSPRRCVSACTAPRSRLHPTSLSTPKHSSRLPTEIL